VLPIGNTAFLSKTYPIWRDKMMNPLFDNIRLIAQEQQDAVAQFVQHLVRTPSLPGQEEEIVTIITNEMVNLGYDEVWVDQAGNIIGKIVGNDGPVILLNGHMDHVDPGPIDGWPYSPFSGEIVEGELWGRGSVDMKGPLACMIYAASLFKPLGLIPPGDILMTVAVMEEVGGVGTQYLASQLKADAAICGEPSRNILRRGHRGRVELQATFKGRSAHASVPHLAVNPHYGAAAFLTQLSSLVMTSDDTLGGSTVAPTLYTTDQRSPNVTPGEVYLTLDWRNVPAESPEEIAAKIQNLLDSCLEAKHLSAIQGTATVKTHDLITYTGMMKTMPAIFPSFLLPETDRFVQAARTTLVEVMGRDDGIDIWRFATDGGHLMAAGIPTVGFGPGDERLAHTNQERISLSQLTEAVVAYAALIPALAEAV
jgi:succinyl-diaminopimelate desuccinylase